MADGRIAKAQEKSNARPVDRLKSLLKMEDVQARFQSILNENAGAFVSSIIEVFTADTALAQCDPAMVIAESFKAASVKLPINKQMGFSYIIPYRENGALVPQFQIGYKGYIQLALRSGFYKYINTDVVFDGELVCKDKLTGEVDLSGDKASDKIIGYFAYIELLNGYRKTIYISYDDMKKHALLRSKSYKNCKLGGAWATDFDAMAKKTCIRQLISKYGIMSIEMQNAYTADTVEDYEYDGVPDVDTNDAPSDAVTVDETDETVEAAELESEGIDA